MKNRGILRLSVVFLICSFIIFYNFNRGFLSENRERNVVSEKEEKNIFVGIISSEQKENESVSQERIPQNQTAETPQSSEQTSLPVSAQAVKGKIISRYASPYEAGLNYNKVYLKNNAKVDIDIKSLLEAPLSFAVEESAEPQVLIMHTHTTETFMETDNGYYTEEYTSRTTDNGKNMVKIGAIIADKLNNAGIKTLHDVTQHDNPQYSGSYSRAAKTIKSYLQKYPEIKIVLDLHRDSVSSGESDKVKLVTEINGKKAAQVMLVMGSQSGTVTDFPNWQENLKLAVKLQQKMETEFPTLARPLLLMSKKYNQNLTAGSLLLEFGTDANTLEEACFSAELVGEALVKLIKEL